MTYTRVNAAGINLTDAITIKITHNLDSEAKIRSTKLPGLVATVVACALGVMCVTRAQRQFYSLSKTPARWLCSK